MSNQEEIWKYVIGYEGLYQVSNFGRVKSFKKYHGGTILKNTNKKGGYLSIVLCGIGKPNKSIRIHRLVAEYFVSNLRNFPEVNHKDFNKQNNNYTNLEWVSRSENVKHAVLNHPEMMRGFNKYNKFTKTVKIVQKTLSGDIIDIFNNGKEAADKSGVCHRNIMQVAKKEEFKKGHIRKQAGGFKWKTI